MLFRLNLNSKRGVNAWLFLVMMMGAFSVHAAPVAVVSTIPSASATNIALNSEVAVTFNQEINASQTKILAYYYRPGTSTPSYVNGKISYANRVLKLQSIYTLVGNARFFVEVKNAVSAVGGTTLPQYNFQFTTRANQAPVAQAKTLSTARGIAVSALLSATDAENDKLYYIVATKPVSGVLSGIAPNLTYTPNATFVGTDRFTFYAKDAVGNVSNTATMQVNVGTTSTNPGSGSQPRTVTNYALNITKTVGGNVSGAGISCGATCSTLIAANTSVSLSATALSGYRFDHWEGDCAGYNACSVTMNAIKNVRAVFAIASASGDVCEGLVTDKNPRALAPIAQPAVGGSFIDPAFGTKIVRVTGAGAGSVIKPMYNTIQGWNADETMMILYQVGGTHHLYHGKTYRPIRTLSDIRPANIEGLFWHTSRPDILYYLDASTRKAVEYNVVTRVKTDIADLSAMCPSGGITSGNDIMFSSWDSNTIGFRCMGSNGMTGGYVDISAKRVGATLNLANAGYGTIYPPMPSASGQYFYLGGNVLTRNLTLHTRLDLANYAEHSSLGQDHLGRDIYSIVTFDVGPRGTCGVGSIVNHTLESGECRVLVGPATGYPYTPSSTHVSAVAYKNAGWLAASSVGTVSYMTTAGQTKTPPLLTGEIYLASTNPAHTPVCRVGHHRSWGKLGSMGYWAEPHVVASPTATRLMIGSDWHNSGRVDTYIIELPSYRP